MNHPDQRPSLIPTVLMLAIVLGIVVALIVFAGCDAECRVPPHTHFDSETLCSEFQEHKREVERDMNALEAEVLQLQGKVLTTDELREFVDYEVRDLMLAEGN